MYEWLSVSRASTDRYIELGLDRIEGRCAGNDHRLQGGKPSSSIIGISSSGSNNTQKANETEQEYE